jgi:alpha-glucuronidase
MPTANSPPRLPETSIDRVRVIFKLMGLLLGMLALAPAARAETGADAWLRYSRIDDKTAQDQYGSLPAVLVMYGDAAPVNAAQEELIRGVRGMLGRTLRVDPELPKEPAILLGTFDAMLASVPAVGKMPDLAADGFWLRSVELNGVNCLIITAPTARGVLYGAFALLRKIALGQPITGLNERQAPEAPLRIINQWDRRDGAVERGYAGRSIFWHDGHVVENLGRAGDYGRLLASIGINGLSINAADSASNMLIKESIAELARVANVLRPWGVRLYVALNSAAPQETSGADWGETMQVIYGAIPDFGGFVLEVDLRREANADTQSMPAHVAATNELAEALRPHGGVLFYRCSISDEDGPADDPKFDPALVVFDQLQSLDGQFGDNIILQIKNGPVDFQVREPPSPIFGALEKTNLAIELQITQEYLGQQRHLVFLAPMWKAILEFDLAAKPDGTPVKSLVAGKTFERPLGGFVGVANVGTDENWLGSDLAMANLYAFGRLAWDPNLASKAIADEWTRLTFGGDALVVGTIVDMLLKSWRMYEDYTGPLGMGTLADVTNTHYGPAIEASGPGAWRAWHSADDKGIGKDRTAATGTGLASRYREPVAKRLETLDSVPEELVLFFHHVPYAHPLKSGKTVIQHIYDSHYAAARDARSLLDRWQALAGKIDDERHVAVLKQLRYQAGHAQLWRDAVCNWFLQKSGIADNEGRVGNYPNRFEAEGLERVGYEPLNVTPWETASGGQCAQLVEPSGSGTISMKYAGEAGWFDIGVRYFDENDGASKYKLLVGGQVVDEWTADDTLPSNEPNGHTSTRHQSSLIALRPGDEIRLEVTSDGDERAAIDYLEIDPAP